MNLTITEQKAAVLIQFVALLESECIRRMKRGIPRLFCALAAMGGTEK